MTADVPPLVQHTRDPLPTPGRIWFALIAPPVAWAAQGLIGWWISGETCADGTPEWGRLPATAVRTMLIAVSVAALIVSLAAVLTAYRAWTLRRTPEAREDTSAFTEEFRLGFMAMAGLIIGSIFTAGIVLIGIAVSAVRVCEYMR